MLSDDPEFIAADVRYQTMLRLLQAGQADWGDWEWAVVESILPDLDISLVADGLYVSVEDLSGEVVCSWDQIISRTVLLMGQGTHPDDIASSNDEKRVIAQRLRDVADRIEQSITLKRTGT